MTHRPPASQATPDRRPGLAFSLIELLVTVSIIAILVGIVIVASSQRKGPETQTRIIIAALKGISDEFEVGSGRIVNHANETTGVYEWNTTLKRKNIDPVTGRFDLGDPEGNNGMGTIGQPDDSIERFCWAVAQNATCLQMLKSLGEEVFIDSDDDGFIEVVDGWGIKIQYRSSSTTGDTLPPYPRPFFAAAGEDGKWGNHSTTPTGQDLKDNIYSFEAD